MADKLQTSIRSIVQGTAGGGAERLNLTDITSSVDPATGFVLAQSKAICWNDADGNFYLSATFKVANNTFDVINFDTNFLTITDGTGAITIPNNPVSDPMFSAYVIDNDNNPWVANPAKIHTIGSAKYVRIANGISLSVYTAGYLTIDAVIYNKQEV